MTLAADSANELTHATCDITLHTSDVVTEEGALTEASSSHRLTPPLAPSSLVIPKAVTPRPLPLTPVVSGQCHNTHDAARHTQSSPVGPNTPFSVKAHVVGVESTLRHRITPTLPKLLDDVDMSFYSSVRGCEFGTTRQPAPASLEPSWGGGLVKRMHVTAGLMLPSDTPIHVVCGSKDVVHS